MNDNRVISFHDLVTRKIPLSCNTLDLQDKEKYKGVGWRADVYVTAGSTKHAFEVQ